MEKIMENKTRYTLQSLAEISHYVDGERISRRFKGMTIPVLEYNEAINIVERIVEKATEELRKENDRLKSELLDRDVTWLPAKDAEIERLTQSNKELVEALGLHEPYPLTDILNNLIEATDILLGRHSYDGQRYEEQQLCSKLGK